MDFHKSIIIWSLEWLRVVTRLAGAASYFCIIFLWWTFTSLSSSGLWSGYVLSLGWLEQCHSSATFSYDGLSQVWHNLVSGVVACCHLVGWSSVIVLHHSSVMDFRKSIIIWSLEWLRAVTRLAGAVSKFCIVLLWWTFTSLSSSGLWSGYVLSLGWLEQCHSSASYFCDGLSQVYHHLVSEVVTCCH